MTPSRRLCLGPAGSPPWVTQRHGFSGLCVSFPAPAACPRAAGGRGQPREVALGCPSPGAQWGSGSSVAMEAPRQPPWVQGGVCPFAPRDCGRTGARLPRCGPQRTAPRRLLRSLLPLLLSAASGSNVAPWRGSSPPRSRGSESLAPLVIVAPFCAPSGVFRFVFFFNF